MQKRRKVPPLPHHFMRENPRVVALGPAPLGMLMRIVEHYWFTDCAPLPDRGDRLFVIAQANRPTWKSHRAELFAILNDILPELKASRELWATRHDRLREWTNRGAAMRRATALQKRIDSAPVIPETHNPRRSQETRAARFETPVKIDKIAGYTD